MDGNNGYAHTHLRMDARMRELKGSPLRDLFKHQHKRKLRSTMFGCDLDFVIAEKNPDCIVAFVDLKRFDEDVTFTEVIVYNQLIKVAPLYLVCADSHEAVEMGMFSIARYLGGNRGPQPPVVKLEHCTQVSDWQEYSSWEQGLRDATKATMVQARRGGR
jgi:hypothetical protein